MEQVSDNIVEFSSELKPFFYSLNKDWIDKYFTMEPMDIWQLEHPDEAYIEAGGTILFSVAEGAVHGTVALLPLDEYTFEMSKMAVNPISQGHGIGMQLCLAAIKRAKSLGVTTLVLYSNTKLATAIRLYKRAGFKEVPMDHVEFSRANIKMEIKL